MDKLVNKKAKGVNYYRHSYLFKTKGVIFWLLFWKKKKKANGFELIELGWTQMDTKVRLAKTLQLQINKGPQ